MKRWTIAATVEEGKGAIDDIISRILTERGIGTPQEKESFLHPRDPVEFTPADVEIDASGLTHALARIKKAIASHESVVVYADYDADGITAGAIMWEALFALGARVMPYIPHRADEGYGLSVKGIDAVREQFDPALIITVDHGITAHEKVAYAKSLGIDVVVTDHHVKPETLPECDIVHTTKLAGSGVSWFVAKELLKEPHPSIAHDLVTFAAIGTIADLVPLNGPNRSIAKYGLAALNKTTRVGLTALIKDAGLTKGMLGTYDISHVLAPRLNAMGRLEHALDALRLLCARREDKATLLAEKLGLTNKERQQITEDSTLHALSSLPKDFSKKLIFMAHESYNQGIIGLVAGRLTERYYRPSIILSKGPDVSKASARSIAGFNIIEAIRTCADILVDAGGHPMAAGFTVETKYLPQLQERLEAHAEASITEEILTRMVKIDAAVPMSLVSESLWKKLQDFAPFGFGNSEPVFASMAVSIVDLRLVGATGKHLKLQLADAKDNRFDAIAFGMGEQLPAFVAKPKVDVAYTIDMNEWNGKRKVQLKVRDIRIAQ
jgi:single-stranded-DNA-specific exonuclease